MRILQTRHQKEPIRLMREIGVDPYGIRIMTPKAVQHLVMLDPLSNIAANILKQEMLSLGGDAAIARGALTGKTKKTGCLLMGTLSQLSRLTQKLKVQPFGLNALGKELDRALDNYQEDRFVLKARGHTLTLGKGKTRIMGVINTTPDSFSGDGFYYSALGEVIDYAEQIAQEGADIIDIGGESSRPGAKRVSIKEELARTIPLIKAVAKAVPVPISIDTCKPEVAEGALDNGAAIVNDITGLRNPKMLKILAKYNAAAVAMHMRGTPRSMQRNPHYESLTNEIINFLKNVVARAEDAGINRRSIIIDPGIGFGKTVEDNLRILERLEDFKILGKPILVGTSRKSFIGKIIKAEPHERIFGSISSGIIAAHNGAHIIRAHDVKQTHQALQMFDAVHAQ